MKTNNLERLIFFTILYYDVLGGYPLTSFEVCRYLINPYFPKEIINHRFELNQIFNTLDKLENNQIINQKNGFYFIQNKQNLVQERIEKQKIAEKKWKKIKRIARLFQAVPYVKATAVSGSLALSNTKTESDLDILIIAKYGRIWITRAILVGLSQLIRQRRHGRMIKDKICLNWFITDKFLELRLKNLSRAIFCQQLIPFFGIDKIKKFYQSNQWVNNYLFCHNENNKAHLKTIKQNIFFKMISQTLEKCLDNKFGDFMEKIAKNYQKNKIMKKVKPEYVSFSRDEMKKNTQAHLCLSDEALIFHYPVSRNLQIENEFLTKLWINCG